MLNQMCLEATDQAICWQAHQQPEDEIHTWARNMNIFRQDFMDQQQIHEESAIFRRKTQDKTTNPENTSIFRKENTMQSMANKSQKQNKSLNQPGFVNEFRRNWQEIFIFKAKNRQDVHLFNKSDI